MQVPELESFFGLILGFLEASVFQAVSKGPMSSINTHAGGHRRELGQSEGHPMEGGWHEFWDLHES